MRVRLLPITLGIGISLFAVLGLRADHLEMQNGDRYSGKVLAVSADNVVLESEVLGKITVPRTKVARLAFGTNAVTPVAVNETARVSGLTNRPTAGDLVASAKTNGGTNFVQQIREQMLAGNPGAVKKYDELASGLMNGKLNLTDLRREAKASADQLRELKRELGADADDSLDGYLEVLNNFLNEPATEATTPADKRIVR